MCLAVCGAVRDVCLWVDSIGMGQYRPRFAHHCIDGRLLVTLTDAQLKVRPHCSYVRYSFTLACESDVKVFSHLGVRIR